MKIHPQNSHSAEEEESKEMCLGWFSTSNDVDELKPIKGGNKNPIGKMNSTTEEYYEICNTTNLLHKSDYKSRKASILDTNSVNILSDAAERERVENEYYKGTIVAENSGKARLSRMCDEIKSAKYNEDIIKIDDTSSHQFQL